VLESIRKGVGGSLISADQISIRIVGIFIERLGENIGRKLERLIKC
jgi:hypothetical protein